MLTESEQEFNVGWLQAAREERLTRLSHRCALERGIEQMPDYYDQCVEDDKMDAADATARKANLKLYIANRN